MNSSFTTIRHNMFSAIWCKVFVLCAIIILFFANTGISQTWTEDWEGNWTTNWNVSAGTWEVGTPTSGPGNAYNGQNCAATVLGGNYPANANTRLIRHSWFVVPSANENPRLRFWHWYSISSGDQAVVQIKTATSVWQSISPSYINTSSSVWTYPFIDLSSYSDSTVQISFYFTSDGNGSTVSSGWYVDDVAVITGSIIFNNPETWELGLGDWYGDRGTWEVGEPTSGPNSAHNGQNCAATRLGGNYAANVNSRLISPYFTLPDVSQNPGLNFWHWYSISSGDQAVVQIKTEYSEWQTILGPYTSTSGGVWSPVFFNLTAFSDSTIQIAFQFTSDGNGSTISSGWYIDEIMISPYIVTTVEDLNDNLPLQFQLYQNYPNPFNPTTIINYQLPVGSHVTLKVYDLLGREVATIVNEEKPAGSYEINFNANNLSSGIYFYKLQAGTFAETKKMILIK